MSPRARCRDDAGTYSVEAILVVPLVLIIVLGTFQVALWAAARNYARAAADRAVIAATIEGGTIEQASEQAEQRLKSPVEAGLLANHQVDVTPNGTDVRVAVTGDVLSLVPGLPIHVNVTSTGSTERWTSP